MTKAAAPSLTAAQPTAIGGTGSIPTTAAHEFSMDGTAWSACTGETTDLAPGSYYVRVAASGTVLASDAQTVTISAFDPGREPTPAAVFTATGADTGTLTNVSAGMTYAVDGGAAVDITGTSVGLTGLAPCTITVVKPGNGTTTVDSDEQTIAVTKAAAPSLTAAQPTAIGGTGSIPTTAAHEFGTDGVNWTDCGGVLNGLAAGTYYVRVKAAGTALASDTQRIVITAFTPEPEPDPDPEPPAVYTVTAVNGMADRATAEAGETVTVTADHAPAGKSFRNWTGSEGVVFADAYAAETSFVMPAHDVTVTANFRSAGEPHFDRSAEPRYDEVDPSKGGSLDNFKRTGTYMPGMFSDVYEDAWYAENVRAAVEFSLMLGLDDGTFGVGEDLKVSEALALACRLHNICYGGSGVFDQTQDDRWYDVYFDYAGLYGFLPEGLDPEQPVTRAQFAALVSAALPDEALAPVNDVTEIPDMAPGDPGYAAVLRLYRAGILTGMNAQGDFCPDAPITREQIAAVVTRVADPSLRKTP